MGHRPPPLPGRPTPAPAQPPPGLQRWEENPCTDSLNNRDNLEDITLHFGYQGSWGLDSKNKCGYRKIIITF